MTVPRWDGYWLVAAHPTTGRETRRSPFATLARAQAEAVLHGQRTGDRTRVERRYASRVHRALAALGRWVRRVVGR